MSIEIGVPNNRYGTSFIDTKKYESLNINSYKTPDAMQLNTDNLSFSNVYISYKNFKTGVDDIGFSIYKESLCLATFNSNIITTFQDAEFKGNFAIGDIVSVQSNINTNITFNLQHDADVLNINSNNVPFFQINTNEINFSRDFKMNGGTLYVGKIEGPSANTPIVLRNIQYEDAILDSVIASTRLAVDDKTIFYNNSVDSGSACLEITKINNNRDFMKIYSDAVINGGQIMNINKDGNINIGKNEGYTESTINISKISPNIINYNGLKSGDIFQISENADIGIGTTKPDAQLHIKRNDGENIEDQTFYRNNTMMYLDMHYNEYNNFSNYYIQKEGTFNESSKPEYLFVEDDLALYVVNQEVLANAIPVQDSLVNSKSLILNIKSMGYTVSQNVISNATSQTVDNFATFIDNNLSNITLKYPDYTNYNLKEKEKTLKIEVGTNANDRLIKITNNMLFDIESAIIDVTTYQTCNIDLYTRYFDYIPDNNPQTTILTCIFQLELNIQLENEIDWEYNYKLLESTTLPRPNFLKLDSNNNFISSISANGTLSLGAEVPENKNDYLIYAPGKSHIETLNVSNFSTDNIDNIIVFGNANLLNINSIQTQSISIANLTVDRITSPLAIFEKSSVEDITFDIVSSDFLKYDNQHTNIKNKLIIGEVPSLPITQNSLLEINVKDSKPGLVVQNSVHSIDPCLEIIGKAKPKDITGKAKPMMKLTNISPSKSSSMTLQYYNDPDANGGDIFHFQVYCSEKNTPKVLNYCSTLDVLAIGGNAICINYKSQNNYKITIGIRNPDTDPSVSEQEYSLQSFINYNNTNKENVEIYGNLKINTKDNETLIQTFYDTDKKGKIIINTENIQYKRGTGYKSFDQIVESIFVSSFSAMLDNVYSDTTGDATYTNIRNRIKQISNL